MNEDAYGDFPFLRPWVAASALRISCGGHGHGCDVPGTGRVLTLRFSVGLQVCCRGSFWV